MQFKYLDIEENDKPVLVNIPSNGLIQLEKRDKDFNFEKFNLKEKGNKIKLLAEDSKAIYKSTIYKDKITKNYSLGFYSKSKNKLIFIENHNFVLEKIQKNILSKSNYFDNNDDKLDQQVKKEIVIGEIGSKKSKVKLEKYKEKNIEENKINKINEIKTILNDKAKVIKSGEKDNIEAQKKNEIKRLGDFLPPFDLECKGLDIYNFSNFLKHEFLIYVKTDYIKNYLSNKEEKINIDPYIINIIDNIEDLGDNVDMMRKISFMNYMKLVYDIRNFNINIEEFSRQKNIPNNLLRHILYRFNEVKDKRFYRSDLMKLKFLCHLLVLNLTIQNNKLDLYKFMKFTKIDEAHAINIAKEVGCVLKRKDNILLVKIKKLNIKIRKNN